MDVSKLQLIIKDATNQLNMGKSVSEVATLIRESHLIGLNDARFLFVLVGLCNKFGVEIPYTTKQ